MRTSFGWEGKDRYDSFR